MSGLRSRYASLDALPRRLFGPVVTHLHGDLEERAGSVVVLRSALLRGELPSGLAWPTDELGDALLEALRGAGLVDLCRGEPEVVDEVIATILDAVTDAERLCFSASAHFAGLALAEHERRRATWRACEGGCTGGGGLGGSVARPSLDEGTRREIQAEARRISVDVATARIRAGMAPWSARVEAIAALRELVASLAPRQGWTLSRGLLRALSVQSATSAYDLVKHLGRLRELVLVLGRLRDPNEASDETIFERLSGPMKREMPRPEPAKTPEPGPELRGLERSGDFTRMLPSEAAWLVHPTARRAWHARRAENALLVYRAEQDRPVVQMRAVDVDDGADLEATRRVRGPILVCLDTSGSMEGSAGSLAKAVVLHLAMVAHDEGRALYLYAFSGPGDVVEHELSPDGDGAEALLAFLVLDFQGGTDVSEPLRRALARHDEAAWSRADLLVVSDGQFEAPREIVAALAKRRAETALRTHGLLLGPDARAMSALCERVHRFAEWVQAESPA